MMRNYSFASTHLRVSGVIVLRPYTVCENSLATALKPAPLISVPHIVLPLYIVLSPLPSFAIFLCLRFLVVYLITSLMHDRTVALNCFRSAYSVEPNAAAEVLPEEDR